MAAWAAQSARAFEADGRLDDALLIAREAHDSIGDRCGAGAVACGNDGDAWLLDSDAADAQRDIAELEISSGARRRFKRCARRRRAAGRVRGVRQGVAGSSTSLDRVEAVNDVASHVEEHVRPVCREHDVDADDILTAYISARAERHTQLKKLAETKADEAASENDDLAFAVAALDEVDDDAKRTSAALTILTAARAPLLGWRDYIAHRSDLLDSDASVDEKRRPLADAARLVRLAHLAHRHRVPASTRATQPTLDSTAAHRVGRLAVEEDGA